MPKPKVKENPKPSGVYWRFREHTPKSVSDYPEWSREIEPRKEIIFEPTTESPHPLSDWLDED